MVNADSCAKYECYYFVRSRKEMSCPAITWMVISVTNHRTVGAMPKKSPGEVYEENVLLTLRTVTGDSTCNKHWIAYTIFDFMELSASLVLACGYWPTLNNILIHNIAHKLICREDRQQRGGLLGAKAS